AVSDGDLIDLGAGIELSVVHCPGHTPGHVAYYWGTEGYLFTADCVQGQGGKSGDYPYYFNAGDYRRSLMKLARLDIHALCLGHAFMGGALVNAPIRRGVDASAFLHASMDAADAFHRAVSEAMRRMPQASKREVAAAALDELIYEIPQLRVRSTGMPMLSGATLVAHMEAVRTGDYPL
nr:MBL fold metallo-hydrolase [Dehalococcoidales bacterium]